MDWLPEELLTELRLPTLRKSLLTLHRPSPDTKLSTFADGQHPGQRRLAFEELLAHQLSLQLLRQRVSQHRAVHIPASQKLAPQFISSLGFQLTGAQQSVVDEIRTDLEKNIPMQRLVQGDVGSGKTVVAALAALDSIEAGYQAAMMAPIIGVRPLP